MASGVNDFGVGQYQVDQSDVAEIIGHLVYKKRSIAALDTGGLQVTLTQFTDLLLC